MVRDLMLNMKERDLLTENKSLATEIVFDSLWGNIFDEDEAQDVLICNIIIPEGYWALVNLENNQLVIRFKSSYHPSTSHFRARLVGLSDGNYGLFKEIRGDFGIQVNSYALSNNIAAPIAASMLPYIDIDGDFLLKFVLSSHSELLDKAYIYSSKCTDINIGFSDDQASQLLSLCAPGKNYRYPTSGVGVTNYLNRVIAHTDLQQVLEDQFNTENKPLTLAEFDNETGVLNVICTPEQEVSDKNLKNVSDLDVDFFKLFTDDYVRRNIVLDELSDSMFLELFSSYERILEIILFTESAASIERIANNVVSGRFDPEGNIVEDEDYFVVSATLEANTIVMFDDEAEDTVKDSPIFTINDSDESKLYVALIEQPYWITESCHKCFILKKRSTVRYMIRKENFRLGKGLYIVHQTSANLKNMFGLVQDLNTGRLLGIVSSSTNITDTALDEITQHIYATI